MTLKQMSVTYWKHQWLPFDVVNKQTSPMITAPARSCEASTDASISHADELNVHLRLCRLQSSLHLNNFALKLHS